MRSKFLRSLEACDYSPDVLVNNAGHVASVAFVDTDRTKIDAILRLNMIAPAPQSR
ncbi:hypothetical protein [Mesorhizobium sp. INR15]|uniref:hypothetical protein n=1 Tax=Mesorhizobium sp. INR15 TaxID=2654248 RepID=UPI0018966153|nr:hypothetical protein [Mesorhizobium sp. INR15]